MLLLLSLLFVVVPAEEEPDDPDALEDEDPDVEATRPAVGEAQTVDVTVIVMEEEVRVLVKVERGREDAGATISVKEEIAPSATATVVAEDDAGMVVAVYMSANPLDEDPTMTFCFMSERAVGYEAGNPIGVLVVAILDFEVDEVVLFLVEDELVTAVEDTFARRPVAFPVDADALMVPLPFN